MERGGSAFRGTAAVGMVVALLCGLLWGQAAVAAEPAPLLIEPAWLHARLADPKLRIIDMSTEPEAYRRGHVPGAVYLHVNDSRIQVPAGGFRLPTPEEGARLMDTLGIGPETMVVLYDDAGGLHASRLFFTLDVWGHAPVSVLNGGIQSWRRAGLPLSRDLPAVMPTGYRPALRPERVASAEWVRDHLDRPEIALVDTRTPEEFSGRDVRAKRGGHIPGATNIDWRSQLGSDGRFKPREQLQALYQARGITPEKTVVTYCQTHHRASHNYFVLRLLGYEKLVGYDRSWAEWGNRDDLPVAK